MQDILEKTKDDRVELSEKEISYILKMNDPKELKALYSLADQIRLKYVKNQVCIHGIIEFSNYCRNNCLYCGIRKDNQRLKRYRMSIEEIVNVADWAVNRCGYKMLVLQSGEDLWFSKEKLVEIIKRIKDKCRVFLFMSIGERDFDTYAQMYIAGAKGVLFRFETSDPKLYSKLHPGLKYESRIEHLSWMKNIGYLVASGPLIGLPGQTEESLARDILLTKEIEVNMISMGLFIVHPDTPLSNYFSGRPELFLKTITAARLVYKNVRIPITTAYEVVSGKNGREQAFRAGANSIMLNLTPEIYRKNYNIYPGKTELKEHVHSSKSTKEAITLIRSLERRVCKGWGKDYTLTASDFMAGCR